MVKKFLFYAVMLVGAMTLSSCGGDEDEPTPEFKIYETFNTWGASKSQALAEMKKLGWTYVTEAGNEVVFEMRNKDIESSVYFDEHGGLLSVYVFYHGYNSFFNDLKNELSKRYNIVWKDNPQTISGTTATGDTDASIWTFNHKTKGESMAYYLSAHFDPW